MWKDRRVEGGHAGKQRGGFGPARRKFICPVQGDLACLMGFGNAEDLPVVLDEIGIRDVKRRSHGDSAIHPACRPVGIERYDESAVVPVGEMLAKDRKTALVHEPERVSPELPRWERGKPSDGRAKVGVEK